jgi:uncharacterized peroxidase-related enzyme
MAVWEGPDVSHLPLVDPVIATAPVTELFAEVQRRFGATPNMTRAMANSPALLAGYLDLSGALNRGVLDAATRERIALTIAQANSCSYCLSAHSYLAEHVAHLDAAEITAARKAAAPDSKTAAILAFAAAVNDGRGTVTDDDITAARAARLTEEEIAETIGQVALNVLTNYFNKAVDVDIDFPVVTV